MFCLSKKALKGELIICQDRCRKWGTYATVCPNFALAVVKGVTS